MIIIDYNQAALSAIFSVLQYNNKEEISENMIRHIVLNIIRQYRNKFKNKFGNELIIVADGKDNWRRDFFPFYKAARRQKKEESSINWNLVYEIMANILVEIKNNFPYKVMKLNNCEADDTIAVLCRIVDEQILIISGDKDFAQLHNDKIKQYSAKYKKFINVDNPALFLKQHIIKGDISDGVPNILSKDDTFVSKTRQKPITNKKLDRWLLLEPEEFCENETILRNYKRNETLIDLKNIPQNIVNDIQKDYELPKTINNKSKLFNYFIEKQLKNLMEDINDF